MVRETRYLLVGNLPEKTTEDEITEYFKRHGKIQSVKIHGQKDENATSATVAFTDIKSASKAHNAENRIETNLLRTEYSEGSATGKVVTRTQETAVFPHAPRGPSTYSNRSKGCISLWIIPCIYLSRHKEFYFTREGIYLYLTCQTIFKFNMGFLPSQMSEIYQN